MPDNTAACLVCRTHHDVRALARCEEFVCPACGAHGHVAPFGVWAVPPAMAAHVRATVWGRGH